jgi:two-component system phosphate regulon sensor histidine kinase PhoR
MRLPRTLLPVVALALALVAGLADRALVGQAAAARAAAIARLDADAKEVAQAVRAALAPIEQAVAAGRPPEGVALERFSVAPHYAVAPAGLASYASRSRAELAALLASTRTTPNGLPEAIVARLALGPAAPVSGAGGAPAVEERLLAGELPVRPEDLPFLAGRLGLAADPRVASLLARLRQAPAPGLLPPAPAFRRALSREGLVEGWSQGDGRLLHYELPPAVLLERAAVAERAAAAPAGSARADEAAGQPRTILVPDVEGLAVAVRPRLPDTLRLAALRAVLWLSAGMGAIGLLVLRRALAHEERALSRERAFLSGVTHELRAPLTSIRVLGETLAEGRGEPREYGALVAAESQRLEALVERVLTLARLEQRPRFGLADPGELLRSAVAVMGPRAERRGARIECRIEASLPECRWDGDAVRRALLNLLDNAVAHGRTGGNVRATASASDSEVSLAVSDDGPGIARAERRRIFGRFERARTEAPGTGLGLYLVEEVARAHGGRVDLVTAEGRGSTFTLVLPARPGGAYAGAVE